MKNLIVTVLTTAIYFAPQSGLAQNHTGHPQHNMVLFGEAQLYASHIVYKEPHNYQVILSLDLASSIKAAITNEMHSYPKDRFILLLDSTDISQIQSNPKITGQVFRRSSDNRQYLILPKIEIEPHEYSIIYFNELPLNLSVEKILNISVTQKSSATCRCERATVKCDGEGTRSYFCRCSDGSDYWECR